MVQNDTRTSMRERLLILPLAISRGITNLPTLVVSILLIEIATSYNITPAVAGQLNTAASLLAIIFALIMGILSIKYDNRNILILGLFLYVFSIASSFLAGSLYILLPLFAITGIARAMIDPMINSLIGIHIPAEKRTSVIGYTVGSLAFIYVIGSLSAAYLSKMMDWHLTLLLIVAPISIITIILALYLIPQVKSQVKDSSTRYLLSGYRESLGNRSVLACLVGTAIGMATWNIYLIYHASFMRQTFSVSASFVSQVIIFFSFTYIFGSLITGRLAKKFGKKTLTVGTMSLLSFFSVFSMIVNNLYLVIGIGIVACLFAGMLITIQTSLTLDQVPQFRGTVMSLQSAAVSFGSMVSAMVGGIIISYLGYGAYAITMGLIGFIGAIVFHFFSKDPTNMTLH